MLKGERVRRREKTRRKEREGEKEEGRERMNKIVLGTNHFLI